MARTTLSLNYTQYQTIKALFHATSKDETRYVLMHVYYRSKDKKLFPSDGHIMRVEEMDLGENDIYFKKKYFMDSRAALSTKMGRSWTKHGAEKLFYFEWEDELVYHDVDKVIPRPEKWKTENDAPVVSLDMDKLVLFRKSLIDEYSGITLVTVSEISPVVVFHCYEDNRRFLGVIMPLRHSLTLTSIEDIIQERVKEMHQEIAQAA